nr:hypothetical protein [uncultured archaeon]
MNERNVWGFEKQRVFSDGEIDMHSRVQEELRFEQRITGQLSDFVLQITEKNMPVLGTEEYKTRKADEIKKNFEKSLSEYSKLSIQTDGRALRVGNYLAIREIASKAEVDMVGIPDTGDIANYAAIMKRESLAYSSLGIVPLQGISFKNTTDTGLKHKINTCVEEGRYLWELQTCPFSRSTVSLHEIIGGVWRGEYENISLEKSPFIYAHCRRDMWATNDWRASGAMALAQQGYDMIGVQKGAGGFGEYEKSTVRFLDPATWHRNKQNEWISTYGPRFELNFDREYQPVAGLTLEELYSSYGNDTTAKMLYVQNALLEDQEIRAFSKAPASGLNAYLATKPGSLQSLGF